MTDGKSLALRGILQIPEVTQGRKNPLWMGLATRLEKLRRAADLTLNGLSRATAVACPIIWRLESGDGRPMIDTVEKLAFGLGVSPVYVAFGPEGGEPFRLKTPSYLKSEAAPVPKPGQGVYSGRYLGCAERLRKAREMRRLSLRELAAAAQVSYQAVQYTESGQTVPRVDTIEAIAVALDVAPGWLAYGEDE